MFNVEDKEMIMNIINNRKENELVIPLYVRVGNIRYSLFEVDEIPDCSPSIFKIGFGSSNSVFTRIKFPNDRLMYFSEAKLFNHFDEDKQILIQYITFELDYEDTDNFINNESPKYGATAEDIEIMKRAFKKSKLYKGNSYTGRQK